MSEPVVRYRERLGAPWWLWAVLLVGAVCIAIAFGAALGSIAFVTSLLVFAGLATWLLLVTSLTICVTDDELRVGRAHIGWQYIGLVATLDQEATRAACGAEADPRAFAAIRSLSAKQAVTVEICDDTDPHPYWIISSRDPQKLGELIRQTRQSFLARK